MAAKYASTKGKFNLTNKLNDLTPVDWLELCKLSSSQTQKIVYVQQPAAPSNGRLADHYSDIPVSQDLFEEDSIIGKF